MADRVIIKNLDWYGATKGKILDAFNEKGFKGLMEEHIHINRRGQGLPGKMCVAFVTLKDQEEVDRAILKFKNCLLPDLSSKPILVQKAVPQMRTLEKKAELPADQDSPDFYPYKDLSHDEEDAQEKKQQKKLQKKFEKRYPLPEPTVPPGEGEPVDLEIPPWRRRVKMRNNMNP